MGRLTLLEQRVLNDGERLIPGRSHDRSELVRHRSTYWLFRRVIERDVVAGEARHGPLRILDLGCGVGHGSALLAEIPGTVVVGIDNSPDALSYARENYASPNVSYAVAEAPAFVATMPEFDYVVSRHMLEHFRHGIALGLSCRWRNRLFLSVPFREPEGNKHHAITGIDKGSFPAGERTEFLYEDLDGVTHDGDSVPNLNSITYATRRGDLPAVTEVLAFPLPAWRPSPMEESGLGQLDGLVPRVISGVRKVVGALRRTPARR